MRINRHDTNGTKPLLGKGELGYDDYVAGGDVGRVYVGTGSENIALAERLESNMMTKAQFNALAEERKTNRAGSGFDEWGKHTNNNVTLLNVNEGIYTFNASPNTFVMGRKNADTMGTSKTTYPVVCVNGVLQKLDTIGLLNTYAVNTITLPTAPNIYPYDTVLTSEQIASGVIKHADASNSGLIVNGKFDTDTSGWTLSNGIWDNGSLRVGPEGIPNYTDINVVVGKTYRIEYDYFNQTGNRVVLGISFNGGTTLTWYDDYSKSDGKYYATVTATSATMRIDFRARGGNSYANIDNIAVYPADAISRSDLVFLESWHEDVSEKNFVYPLGNVQYLGGNTDGLTGIANSSFSGFETYSLFGNFQASSALIGKGYVWSSLTEAQKKAFIANPENNCYLDGDKTIQVRYRVRVVLGEDSNSMSRATVQGKAVIPSTVLFTVPTTTVDAGLYSNTSVTYTYAGTSTSAISIANVSRKNQGISHPTYNPNGSKKLSDGNFWYNTSIPINSTMGCFDSSKMLTASGYIGTVSGRPDGLFYDQVHEGDITDLRNSSKKVEDYNRLISREFNKLVAGTTRGKEGEKTSIYCPTTMTVQLDTWITITSFGATSRQVYSGASQVSSNVFYQTKQAGGIYDAIFARNTISGNVYKILGVKYYPNGTYIHFDHSHGTVFTDTTSTYDILLISSTTRTKSNTLLHCDIIGNPTNYPTAWKQNGVFGTPLIVAEDGTSLLPDGVKDTFKLSRKANATPLLCLRSTDNGATWTSFTPTFSTTTNEITLTNEPAGNLVMVYYQTKTTMAVPVVNSEVLEIGDVFASNAHSNPLLNTLINKNGIVSGVYASGFLGKPISFNFIEQSKLNHNALYYPTNTPITLGGGTAGVPTVKILPYLTRTNGKAFLNLVFKEMKHNGTSWGDSNKFEIVDNVSTTTDNNAQTVLIGQKTVELNVFIGNDE